MPPTDATNPSGSSRAGADTRAAGSGPALPPVIVILGSNVEPDGTAGARLARRVARGIAEAKRDPASRLLLTGGIVRGPRPEAHAMRDLVRAAGIPDSRVTLEPAARNTLENALCSARLLGRQRTRLTLVTDWLHSPRACLTFRSVGLSVTAAPAPWGPRDASAALWIGGVLYEAAALLWYGLRIACGVHRRAAKELLVE